MRWLLLSLSVGGTLGPEISLGPRGPNASAPNLQWAPAAASDGTDFVLVWGDKRRELSTHSVFAARIRSDGLLLDPVGIPVGPLHADGPRVAYLGDGRYVISWTFDGLMQARLLGTDGTWASDVIAVGNGYCGDVAAANSRFALAWYDGQIRARRFNGDGGAIEAMPVPLSPPLGTSVCPVIAADRGAPSWTANWVQQPNIVASFIPSSGAPSTMVTASAPGGAELRIHGLVGLPGASSLLAWSARDTTTTPLWGTPQSPASPLPSHILWSGDGGEQEIAVTLGADGELRGLVGLGLYAVDGWATVIAPLDGGAPVSGPAGTDLWGTETVLAASANRLLVATSNSNDIVYAVADQRFGFIDGGVASMSGAAQTHLALGASPNGWLAAWSERSGQRSRIIARRLDTDGNPLGATLVLSPAGASGEHPSVAFAASTWAIVWDDPWNGIARFALLDEAGTLIAGDELIIATRQTAMPYVIADQGRFAIVASVFVEDDVYFASLERDGGLSAGSRVAAVPDFPYWPKLARGDGGFLVAWEQPTGSDSDVLAARLDLTGQTLDPSGFQVAATAAPEFEPHLAYDGEAFVVSWHDYSATSFARVTGTNVSSPIQPLVPGARGGMRQSTLVAQPGGALAAVCDTDTGDVFAALLAPFGTGLDAGPQLTIAAAPEFACEPAVAGTGKVLFGYGRMELGPQAMGAKARLYTGDPGGAACTEPWRCLSGRCSAGLCDAPSGTGGGSGAAGGSGTAGGNGAAGGNSTAGGAVARDPAELRISCGCSVFGVWNDLFLVVLLVLRRRRR